MDDVALANYVAGCHTGHVEAGRLDRTCAGLLGLDPGTVIWFSDYTFIKLKARHGEINFAHYRHMPSILLRGFLAKGRRANLLEFWWINSEGGMAAFFVVLKATRKREVFVETFHPISLKEARRVLKKAKSETRLVREQVGAERLLSPGTDHLPPRLPK